MAMSNAEEIPEEIIVDILTWLPTKSVGQFRCVSQRWNSLLSDPKFIKAHLTNSHKHEQEKLIILSESLSLHTITFIHSPKNEIGVLSRELNFPQFFDYEGTICGSCNGLVFVAFCLGINLLINPLTLEYHSFPNIDTDLPVRRSISKYGLGYDAVSDDYKVVIISYSKTRSHAKFVDVYSVKKGFWRTLETYNSFLDNDSGVLINGALHWLICKTSSYAIAAFDVRSEKFLELPTPSTLDKANVTKRLVALRGCLCVLTTSDLDEVVVWIMNDYGVEKSWTKFKVKGPYSDDYLKPLCLMGEDEVVLDRDGSLILYNKREDKWRSMMLDGFPTIFSYGGTTTFRGKLCKKKVSVRQQMLHVLQQLKKHRHLADLWSMFTLF